MSESESDLTRRLKRETRARQRAESLLEDSNRKLASSQRSLRRLVGRMEARVDDQTEHQSDLLAARRENLTKTSSSPPSITNCELGSIRSSAPRRCYATLPWTEIRPN